MIDQPVEKKKRRSKAQVTEPKVLVAAPVKPAKKPRAVKPTPVPPVVVTPVVEPTPVPKVEFLVVAPTPISLEEPPVPPAGTIRLESEYPQVSFLTPKKSLWQRFLDVFR